MNITGGKFNSRKISAPDSNLVRPTLSKVRESVFNTLFSLMDFEASTFLDAFSGSGIMSLEAVSRGFKKVVSIEKNLKISKITKQNFSLLGLEPNLIVGDAINVLDKLNETFDVIYLDPPYKETELYNKIFKIIEEKNILNKNGFLIAESNLNAKYEVPQSFSLFKEKIYGDTLIRIYT